MKKIAILLIALMVISVGLSGCTQEENEEPSIISFSAEPDTIYEGEWVELKWEVIGATSLTIDNGIGNVSLNVGRVIYPSETITYTLTVENSMGTKNATVTIYVINASEAETPGILFTPDYPNHTLTVSSIDSENIRWSNLDISGTYYSYAGTYITEGETLHYCTGNITITYELTNEQIGSWTFPEIPIANISASIDTSDGNITMTLSGDYLTIDDFAVDIYDETYYYGRTTILEPIPSYEVTLTSDGGFFKWLDINGDGNVGNQDILKIYRNNGLDSGEWYIEINQNPYNTNVFESYLTIP